MVHQGLGSGSSRWSWSGDGGDSGFLSVVDCGDAPLIGRPGRAATGLVMVATLSVGVMAFPGMLNGFGESRTWSYSLVIMRVIAAKRESNPLTCCGILARSGAGSKGVGRQPSECAYVQRGACSDLAVAGRSAP